MEIKLLHMNGKSAVTTRNFPQTLFSCSFFIYVPANKGSRFLVPIPTKKWSKSADNDGNAFVQYSLCCLKVICPPRVDHHKRNLLIIKRHIWKLTKYTTTIKIFEFGWEKVQRSTCSSKTTFLCINFQNSVLYFYGTVLIKKRHKNFFMDRFMVTNCP